LSITGAHHARLVRRLHSCGELPMGACAVLVQMLFSGDLHPDKYLKNIIKTHQS
jgi:hypothetical protein